ncbi:MAG: hypothetical protein M9921_11910 [Fimbriimonadaceae bacterium]|nr:hypothetical protein [Fimbriimonadaceae bacterium]
MRHSKPRRGTQFASSFWVPFRTVAAFLLLLAPVMAVTIDNPNREWWHLPVAVVGAWAFCAIPLFYATWTYRIDVDEEGIGGYDIWNRYHRLAWGDLATIRKMTLAPGFAYLRLAHLSRRPVIWIPLFLVDRQRFDREVARHAGAVHPLARALRGDR